MNQDNLNILKNLRILYVEDDVVIKKIFGEVLEKLFLNVIIASNGIEGLAFFKENQEKLDFIISDIDMPEMDGLEMVSEIKKINPNIPCILTTAHGDFDYFMRANEVGIFRYMQKPLDVNELLEAINDFQNGLEVKKIDL